MSNSFKINGKKVVIAAATRLTLSHCRRAYLMLPEQSVSR